MVYLPPLFNETDSEILVGHIERYDFGLLVSHGAGGLIASQIPFLVERRDGRLYLLGHLARANPQLADLDPEAGDVLAVFEGPHAYVSPSWYETGPAVPTWNYATVHAYGRAHRVADRDRLYDLVRRLSQRHEGREPAPAWRIEDLPDGYLVGMLNGIVGIEIAISRLEGKFKLSQNRPPADRPRVAAALERRGDPQSQAVAALMRAREPARR